MPPRLFNPIFMRSIHPHSLSDPFDRSRPVINPILMPSLRTSSVVYSTNVGPLSGSQPYQEILPENLVRSREPDHVKWRVPSGRDATLSAEQSQDTVISFEMEKTQRLLLALPWLTASLRQHLYNEAFPPSPRQFAKSPSASPSLL
ncbi:hypothetical protein AJ80_03623 [Polytolypa hystricis UAMH7299]|uniref:Uncharacterized protein n=1 Tax=Polytolypa hystricis (strain UAMH7299) TaxID=1447883 RepID=A0A2B7YGG0_POLH7|nr:hypothetical protein AJ80_03623 [Polytolypa hystricis UAMH7299]